MARVKRSLEELVNKSDSNDDDYSDHPVRSSRRSTSKSKSSRKKPKHDKKRRRRDSEEDIISDNDELSEEDDFGLSRAEQSEDANVEMNARGTVRRQAARNRPTYNESDSSESIHDGTDEGEAESQTDVSAQKQRKSTVVKLKLGNAISKRQLAPDITQGTRRSTRRTRDPSEDIYALTNSGRHMETVEKGTRSPEMQPPRQRRETRFSRNVIEETEREEEQAVKETEVVYDNGNTDAMNAMEDIKTSQIEILESAQPSFDVDSNKTETGPADDEGFVPESENGDAKLEGEEEDEQAPTTRRRNRAVSKQAAEDENAEMSPSQEEPDPRLRRSSRKQPVKTTQRKRGEDESDFEPEEEESNDEELSDSQRTNKSPTTKDTQLPDDDNEDSVSSRRPGLRKRKSRSCGHFEAVEGIAEELAEELQDLNSQRPRRRMQPEIVYEKPRRSRKDVDYRILRPELVLPIEEAENEVTESPSRRGRGGGTAGGTWQRTLFPMYGPFGGGGPAAILAPPGALAAAGGADSDSSDDEIMQHPKPLGPGMIPAAVQGGGHVPTAQTHGSDNAQGISGTSANLGKIKDRQALADADPLGVDVNVNFDSVGGLQEHIDQLKEMVSLPLLYPEIFHRFHIVPPRGVLFHGPPGTGKTLLARALANSVSSEGRKVTFYMRKGADALSKWVGEAERQLRLLFEEARKNQPSIIFFDEIDGLAPVRSSKQEQIHASIVSTLLALMDGMDGRGQVIVIGATNRPDSIDPALRRPGRFDREFYFPLPNTEGRRAILNIHTRGWNPPLPDRIRDELAEITRGYGGADIRALCTEAALNAVQRRYPQIYKSDKKLVIDPTTIEVTPKDFMLAIKKIVPSSERSTSSGASPLPREIEPLLRDPLTEIKQILAEILPQKKKPTALEEAQFEEQEGAGSLRREQMQQEFETSRVFRPRILIRGIQGMGQQYLSAALLHHFEGLHVQAFDLPTLLCDSTRSPEATVVQLFGEVKRHKPSVIYIPNIQAWHETVGPAVMSTFSGLLRSVPPTDPVLLLGVLEAAEDEVDASLMKNLFGYSKRNLYELKAPKHAARHEFFKRVIDYIKKSPTEFPDPEKRKKRVLEVLEIAPPLPPKPQAPLTKEQLKAQKKKDHQTLNLLKIRIQPIMDQMKKYKRFRTGVVDESQIRYLWEDDDPNIVTSDLPIEQRTTFRPFEKAMDKNGVPGLREAVSGKFYYNMDIVTIEKRLSNGYYKRSVDFLADVKRIAKDAKQLGDPERLLRANELLSNVEVDIATIEQTEPALVAECEHVYLREIEREKAMAERLKQAAGGPSDYDPAATDNVPHGNTESTLSSGPVRLGESFNEGMSRIPAQPATPTRRSTLSFMTNGSNLNDAGLQEGTKNGSNGLGGDDGDGDAYMSNSGNHSGERQTQAITVGKPAQPKPPSSHSVSSLQVWRESGVSSLSQKGFITPMAPGSQPNDYSNEASTTQTTSDKKSSEQSTLLHHTQSFLTGNSLKHEFPDLTAYPDRVSQEEQLPDTQQGGSSQPSPNQKESQSGNTEDVYSQTSAPNGGHSEIKHQPPVPLFDAVSRRTPHGPSNLQSLLNNDDRSPKLSLDSQYVENLHQQLTQRTSGCSVEQLEQINSALINHIWKTRGEWNRNKVAAGVIDTFNSVLEDMQSVQEIGPISQITEAQMRGQIPALLGGVD